ncbi:hypothetical protein ACFQ3F_01425 [Nocardioides ginsengisoli]|uniref:PPE domain-containing protein n=1 Tax=Nocardioides ginsengisoli TaxID=363868 RepID=A0ABW3VTQ5_9ACTN
MTGENLRRLKSATETSHSERVSSAAGIWRTHSASLASLAHTLSEVADLVHQGFSDGAPGDPEGTAARGSLAFRTLSKDVGVRRDQMTKAADVIDVAATELYNAEQMGGKPINEPAVLPDKPSRHEYETAEDYTDASKKYDTAKAQHDADVADLAARDAKAKVQLDKLDAAYVKASEELAKIHGEPVHPEDIPPSSENRPGGFPAGPRVHGGGDIPTGHQVKPPIHHPGDPGIPGTGDPGGHDYPGGDGGGDHWGGGGGDQGGGHGGTIGNPLIPGGGSGGGGGGGLSVGGAAVGAGIFGGAGLAGAVRGALGGRGALSSGGGSIGASSRSGGSATLGRSGGSTGSGTPGSQAGRGGGRGAGAGGRGSAGGSGGRGGRGGAGAAGGRGGRRKNDDDQYDEQDLFDDGSDWLDDEGTAPGVLG